MLVRKQWFKCLFSYVRIFMDREKGKCLGKMGDRRKGKALCSWARDRGGHRKVEGGAEGHDGPDVGESPGAWGEGRPHPPGDRIPMGRPVRHNTEGWGPVSQSRKELYSTATTFLVAFRLQPIDQKGRWGSLWGGGANA